MINDVPEGIRRFGAAFVMWAGWTGCIGLTAYDVVNYNSLKPDHLPPPWLGLTIVILIGVAIAGALARSRMRLTDTIVGALQTGMKSQRDETDRVAREALNVSDAQKERIATNTAKIEAYGKAIQHAEEQIAELGAQVEAYRLAIQASRERIAEVAARKTLKTIKEDGDHE